MIGKEYLMRQATILFKFAKTTSDSTVAAGLLHKAADLKAQVGLVKSGHWRTDSRT